MSHFDTLMEAHQVEWRRRNVSSDTHGYQNGLQRPWILPREIWEEGLWPPLRSGQEYSVSAYLAENKISKHTGAHNLKSSWISGANMYFPFGFTESGRAVLASFLRANVDARIGRVDRVELEYAEQGDLCPATLLGETGGNRGSGQTSPDLAIVVNEGSGLILIENKLTEHSFYRCSARTGRGSVERPANPDRLRCNDVDTLAVDPCSVCHQEVWGRKYWAMLREAIDPGRIKRLKCCPAAKAGYQLFRQQALAEGIAGSGRYEFVVSCVALDARNDVLRSSLRSTGVEDVAMWGDCFRGRASFRVFTHQDWVPYARNQDAGAEWSGWGDWIGERYAV